jgi:WD40 repeat protein
MTFSLDNKLIAGVDALGTLLVWEVGTGRLLYQQQPFERRMAYSGSPIISPDGRTLAVIVASHREAGRGKIQLLEPATGHPQGDIQTSSSRLALSPDGKVLAATRGKSLSFFDLATRKELGQSDDGHWNEATQILLSAEGLVVTAGRDHSVRIWDAVTTKLQHQLPCDAEAICLSADGRLLASTGAEDVVQVWQTGTGRQLFRLAGHGGFRGQVSFLPDSQGLLSWGNDFFLREWDMRTGKARFEHAIRPEGIALPDPDDERGKLNFEMGFPRAGITPDGNTFVLDLGGNAHLFDTRTGKEFFKFASEARFEAAMAVAPNGKYLLGSVGDYRAGTHVVSLRELATGITVLRLSLPGAVAGPLCFSPDGRMFSTAVEDAQGGILVYEAASGNLRGSVRGFQGKVRSLAFYPGGRGLASGLTDSSVIVWDLSAPEFLVKTHLVN